MFYKNFYYLFITTIAVFLSTSIVAHEMWIEPLKFSVEKDKKILAHEKVGQNFKGNIYAYLDTSYQLFNINIGDKTRPIKSRLGDIPAVNERVEEEGLVILSAISSGSKLTYETKEKFQKFIKTEGLDWVFDAHEKRGLPDKGFTEIYRRYPKSLIKVGHGQGKDKALGLPFEWVIETNPYTTTGDIKARLLWQGKPFAGAQVSIFSKPTHKSKPDELQNSKLITNDEGRITIPRDKGGLFLINAVKMIKPSKATFKETGAVWESLWASTTYELK